MLSIIQGQGRVYTILSSTGSNHVAAKHARAAVEQKRSRWGATTQVHALPTTLHGPSAIPCAHLQLLAYNTPFVGETCPCGYITILFQHKCYRGTSNFRITSFEWILSFFWLRNFSIFKSWIHQWDTCGISVVIQLRHTRVQYLCCEW